MTNLFAELDYLHERVDQLIRQTALEVGLASIDAPGRERGDYIMTLALNRFKAADDAAGERCGRPSRWGR